MDNYFTKLEHVIFRGKNDIQITENLRFHIPTLDEVYDIGFDRYLQTIGLLTSVGVDIPLILEEVGEDFLTIDDFYLFSKYIVPSVDFDVTSLLFCGFDFKNLHYLMDEKEENCIAIANNNNEIIMTRFVYNLIMFCIRKSHYRERNNDKPTGNAARIAFLEDAMINLETQKQSQKNEDIYENMISTLVNDSGFKYNYDTVFQMKINHFLDSVFRNKKMYHADLLLYSGYSGFGVDLKKINKNDIDRFGPIN